MLVSVCHSLAHLEHKEMAQIRHMIVGGPAAAESNRRWRPVGLGVMGLQDVFFLLRLPFDSPEAQLLSQRIYFHALSTSCDLAGESGRHAAFPETRAARGELQFDHWGVAPEDNERCGGLRARMPSGGLCHHVIIASALSATISLSFGVCECIVPQVSNLFKRETLSGDFLQVNRYLVAELKALGALDRTAANPRQAGGRPHPGNRGNSRRGTADLSYGLGDPNAFPHRHGGGPGRI